MTFLNSILKQAKKQEFPFDHWEYKNVLSEDAIEEIIKADIPDVSKHNLNYDGTRAIDDGEGKFDPTTRPAALPAVVTLAILEVDALNVPPLTKLPFVNVVIACQAFPSHR